MRQSWILLALTLLTCAASAPASGQQYQRELAAVPAEEMVIFPAEGPRRATMTVFTDVSCQYSRMYHEDLQELNAHGIEVRYLAFPLKGPGSEAFEKMAHAWCAQDRKEAVGRLMRGDAVPPRSCDHAVTRHFELGRRLGVSGTPFVVFGDGTARPGYTLPSFILRELGIEPMRTPAKPAPPVMAAAPNPTQCVPKRLGPGFTHNPQVPGEPWGSWIFFMTDHEYPGNDVYSNTSVSGRIVYSDIVGCQAASFRSGQTLCRMLGVNCISLGGCITGSESVAVRTAISIDGAWISYGCGNNTNHEQALANAIADCEQKTGCPCREYMANDEEGRAIPTWRSMNRRFPGQAHNQSCSSLVAFYESAIADQVRKYPLPIRLKTLGQ